MGLFNFFKKFKKIKPNPQHEEIDKLYQLFTDDYLPDLIPWSMMKYQTEVNNGGHYQFFYNVYHNYDLKLIMENLDQTLSNGIRINLLKAYQTFCELDTYCIDNYESNCKTLFENFDHYFYDNEDKIDKILLELAKKY